MAFCAGLCGRKKQRFPSDSDNPGINGDASATNGNSVSDSGVGGIEDADKNSTQETGEVLDVDEVIMIDDLISSSASSKDYLSATENEGPQGSFRDFCKKENLDVAMGLCDLVDQSAVVVSNIENPAEPVVWVSDEFCEWSGWQRDEIIGRKCNFLQGVETTAESRANMRRVISSGGKSFCEVVNYTKDGLKFTNTLYLRPLYDKEPVIEPAVAPPTLLAEATNKLESKMSHADVKTDSTTNVETRILLEENKSNSLTYGESLGSAMPSDGNVVPVLPVDSKVDGNLVTIASAEKLKPPGTIASLSRRQSRSKGHARKWRFYIAIQTDLKTDLPVALPLTRSFSRRKEVGLANAFASTMVSDFNSPGSGVNSRSGTKGGLGAVSKGLASGWVSVVSERLPKSISHRLMATPEPPQKKSHIRPSLIQIATPTMKDSVPSPSSGKAVDAPSGNRTPTTPDNGTTLSGWQVNYANGDSIKFENEYVKGKILMASADPTDPEGSLEGASDEVRDLFDGSVDPKRARRCVGTRIDLEFKKFPPEYDEIQAELERTGKNKGMWFLAGTLDGSVNGVTGLKKFLLHFLLSMTKLFDSKMSYSFGCNGTKDKDARKIRTVSGTSEVSGVCGRKEAFICNDLRAWMTQGLEADPDRPFKIGKVYTMDTGCAVVDFERWQLVNIPQGNITPLSQFWDDRGLTLVLGYKTIKSTDASDWIRMLEIKIDWQGHQKNQK